MIATFLSLVLVRATVILGLALIANRLLSRRSASLRHGLMMSAIVALATLPIVEPFGWEVDILPAKELPTLIMPAGNVSPAAFDFSTDASASTVAYLRVPVPDPAFLILIVWATVAIILINSFLFKLARARRLVANSIKPSDSVFTRLRREGVPTPTPFPIVVSERVSTPCSVGLLRFTVVLPGDVDGWSSSRLAAAVRHEAAHGHRMDYLWHCLSMVVRALYWPNPLVWFATASAAVEREIACDDMTLSEGTTASDYARCLVDLGSTQLARDGAVMGFTNGKSSDLMRRVQSIMSKNTDRTRLSISGGIMVSALVIVGTATLGTVKLQTQQKPLTDIIAQLDSDSATVRSLAAWALGEREDPYAVSALIASLAQGDSQLRWLSAWSLGEIKSDEALPALNMALSDSSYLVREMAALAIGETGNPSSIQALVEASAETALQPAIAWALGEIDHPAARDARNRIFPSVPHDPDLFSGDLQTGNDEADANLLNMLAMGGEKALPAAVEAGEKNLLEAVPALIRMARDEDPDVRATAIWALDEINID